MISHQRKQLIEAVASRAHSCILWSIFKVPAGKERIHRNTIRKVSIAQYIVVVIIFHLTPQCGQCLSFPQCRAFAYSHGLELAPIRQLLCIWPNTFWLSHIQIFKIFTLSCPTGSITNALSGELIGKSRFCPW